MEEGGRETHGEVTTQVTGKGGPHRDGGAAGVRSEETQEELGRENWTL